MNNGEKKKRRLSLHRADKYVLSLTAIMAGAMVLITVLNLLGLRLVRGEVYLFLPVALVVTLLGWGVSLLYRRIRGKGLRIAVGALLAIVAFMMLVVGVSYLGFIATLTVPQRYNTVATEDGAHRLIVMRLLDLDEARINTRHAARLAADPEGSADIIADDWGYVYTAYAPVAGIFYRPDSLIDGEVYLGYASKGQLMVDWEEDGAVGRFFVKDPEPADGGELRARAAG